MQLEAEAARRVPPPAAAAAPVPEPVAPVAPVVTQPEPAPVVTSAPPRRAPRYLFIAGLSTLVVGVASLGAGIGLGLSSRAAQDRVDAAATSGAQWTSALQQDYDAGSSRATAATALYAVGGVLAGVGAILTGLGAARGGARTMAWRSMPGSTGGAWSVSFSIALALGAAGCKFSPHIEDGTLHCGVDGACPPGFSCATDGLCRRAPGNNTNQDLSGNTDDLSSSMPDDLSGQDLAGVDLSAQDLAGADLVCVKRTCPGSGCGKMLDGCGGQLDCGPKTCSGGKVCGAKQLNQCGPGDLHAGGELRGGGQELRPHQQRLRRCARLWRLRRGHVRRQQVLANVCG